MQFSFRPNILHKFLLRRGIFPAVRTRFPVSWPGCPGLCFQNSFPLVSPLKNSPAGQKGLDGTQKFTPSGHFCELPIWQLMLSFLHHFCPVSFRSHHPPMELYLPPGCQASPGENSFARVAPLSATVPTGRMAGPSGVGSTHRVGLKFTDARSRPSGCCPERSCGLGGRRPGYGPFSMG